MEKLGLAPGSLPEETNTRIQDIINRTGTQSKRHRSRSPNLQSSGDDQGKPINIKISKTSKIRNLFTKKLSMLADDM